MKKVVGLLCIAGFAAISMLAAAQSASAFIYRPAGATPIGASMVIAYAPCTTATPPGNSHNPANIAGGACSPPALLTPRLVVGNPGIDGSPPNFRGNAKLSVTVNPSNLQFPAGAPNGNYYNDVRCSDGSRTGQE